MTTTHAEYMRGYYRRQIDKMARYLGGKCVRCGSTSDLEFDHIDPATKVMTISKMTNKPWSEIVVELNKCQLLCKPHHVEKSRREGSYLKGIRYGEENTAAKLSHAAVQNIRDLYVCGMSLNDIIPLYPDISKSAIFRVIQNKTWTDPNYNYVRNRNV